MYDTSEYYGGTMPEPNWVTDENYAFNYPDPPEEDYDEDEDDEEW